MTRKVTIRDPRPWEKPTGDLVYQARYAKNITQEEIAAAIGVKQKQISHIERDTERGPRTVHMDKLATIFRIVGLDPDIAYYQLGALPPDVVEIITGNWKLYKGVIETARGINSPKGHQ